MQKDNSVAWATLFFFAYPHQNEYSFYLKVYSFYEKPYSSDEKVYSLYKEPYSSNKKVYSFYKEPYCLNKKVYSLYKIPYSFYNSTENKIDDPIIQVIYLNRD